MLSNFDNGMTASGSPPSPIRERVGAVTTPPDANAGTFELPDKAVPMAPIPLLTPLYKEPKIGIDEIFLSSPESFSPTQSKNPATFSLAASKAPVTASLIPEKTDFVASHNSIAFAFTVSQFLYNNTPTAIKAPITAIAIPIGPVINVNAAPKPFAINEPAAVTPFHAVCATVCAPVAMVLAPLTIASLAYIPCKIKVSAMLFVVATLCKINAFVAFPILIANPTNFTPAITAAKVATVLMTGAYLATNSGAASTRRATFSAAIPTVGTNFSPSIIFRALI